MLIKHSIEYNAKFRQSLYTIEKLWSALPCPSQPGGGLLLQLITGTGWERLSTGSSATIDS